MEKINCNLCGANDTELIYVERDRLLKLPGSFHLVRCRQCGLLYLNPRPTPEEMKFYYPTDYAPYSIAPEDEYSRITRLDRSYGYWKRARAVIAARPQGGRLLDIGCATGNFLHMVRRLGPWEVYGLDISPEAAEYARQRFGLDIFIGEVAQACYPSAYFDAVTLWDVIEHVHDPKGTLVEIHRILKPGGLLLISTPNLWSWDARIFGRYWVGLDAPRHLFIFSPATLQKLLQKTGFRMDKMRSFTLFYKPFARSIEFWLDEKLGNQKLKKSLLTLLHSRLPRLLTLPYFTLLGHFNKTTAMTIFATREDAGVTQ